MKKPGISDAEWEIMNLVWEEPNVASSRVVEVMEERKGWRSRTTRTLLDRLVRKGALTVETDGRRNLYRAALDMEECVREESRSFLNRVFGGESAAMLLHLVKEADLSPAEIERLRKILNEKGQ